MLNQNFALATANIARANRPDIVPQKNVDYLAAMRQAGSDWQEAQNTAKLQALANALKAKDQALIDNAYADVDPQGRASWLYDRTAKVEDRDAGFQHDFDMEDKRLATKIAAFDYGNRYASQKEKEQRAELDSFVQGLGLDKDKTMKLMAQIRGITVPEDTKISMIDSLTDEYLNPETTDERRGEILPQIEAYREREQQIRALIPSEPKKYATGDLGLVQYMVDNGLTPDEALSRVGKMTPEQKIEFEGQKTAAVEEAKNPFLMERESQKGENALTLENARQQGRLDLANVNAQNNLNNSLALEEQKFQNKQALNLQELNLSVQKANAENELKKNFEQFKSELPTETIRNAQQISALTGEDVNNILLADYRKSKVEAQNALKDIEAKEADIAYKKAQTENAGKTNEIKNYEFAMNNGIDYSTLKPSGTKTDDDLQNAVNEGLITQEEANQQRKRVLLKDVIKEIEKTDTEAKKAEEEEKSKQLAQEGINQLAEVAKNGNIGVFTNWRRERGLTGRKIERDLGKISSSVAAVAPRAISNLKAAGVSGINTKGEFLQYIGLPENPTSEQLMGAIPIMAQIAGVENPIEKETSPVGKKIGGFTIIGVE